MLLHESIPASNVWSELTQVPELWGDGVSLSFATVDCRRCDDSDRALLLTQHLGAGVQLRVSYANCTSDLEVWVSEVQGYASTKAEWLAGPWSAFDETKRLVTRYMGKNHVSSSEVADINVWIVTDFVQWANALKAKM